MEIEEANPLEQKIGRAIVLIGMISGEAPPMARRGLEIACSLIVETIKECDAFDHDRVFEFSKRYATFMGTTAQKVVTGLTEGVEEIMRDPKTKDIVKSFVEEVSKEARRRGEEIEKQKERIRRN